MMIIKENQESCLASGVQQDRSPPSSHVKPEWNVPMRFTKNLQQIRQIYFRIPFY